MCCSSVRPAELRGSVPRTPILAADASSQTKAVLARLDETLSMSFADGSALGGILEYVKYETYTPSLGGIPIYVDPTALQAALVSLPLSTVSVDLEGVPLKTTLRLTLSQLGGRHGQGWPLDH